MTARLAQQQAHFADAIRCPGAVPLPEGVPEDRMAVYQTLFFNNVEGFMAGGFPVLKSVLEAQEWAALVRDFFAHHPSKTPLFIEISGEFVEFIRTRRLAGEGDRPFLAALAHYEWVELALAVREGEPPPLSDAFLRDPLPRVPVLSPLVELMSYDYPVHLIGPGQIPEAPSPGGTQLLVYRGRDDEVHFVELNTITFRFLSALGPPGGDLRDRLQSLSLEIGHASPEAVLQFGVDLLKSLHQKGIVGPKTD